MRSVLVHVVNKQPAISEIYRVLKPGGKLCAFEPIIRSNTRYWEILDPMYVEKYEDFKQVENEIMENPLDSLCNFDEHTLETNLEIAGFSVPEVKLQEVRSRYVVQPNMVREWFINPPSPNQPSTKERYLKYFDEPTVEKFMQDVQNYLTGREISLKTNAVFINATKQGDIDETNSNKENVKETAAQPDEAQTYLKQGYYVVRQGDNLAAICRKIYQTTAMMDKVCEANGIDDPDAIYAGQYLTLPN